MLYNKKKNKFSALGLTDFSLKTYDVFLYEVKASMPLRNVVNI